MQHHLELKENSVKASGITTDFHEALCEFVWNSLEANATNIELIFKQNPLTGLEKIIFKDNGEGIDYDNINQTFGAFLFSSKNKIAIKLKSKENKGKGRFSFLCCAHNAKWHTIYKKDHKQLEYDILIDSDTLNVFEASLPLEVDNKEVGTIVELYHLKDISADKLKYEVLEDVFLREFAWYLYLEKDKGIKIKINGQEIELNKYINYEYSLDEVVDIKDYQFKISLVVWKKNINEKFNSYFLNSNKCVVLKDTTTFNRNLVEFAHSIFVTSKFFDKSNPIFNDTEEDQMSIFDSEKEIKKELRKHISYMIEKQVKKYTQNRANEVIKEMESRGTFPRFSNDRYGQIQKEDFRKVLKEMYRLEPKIFHKLKPIQEKSLLGFLNLLLKSEERENVLDIIEQIVELSESQRKNFAQTLKKTRLSNVIETIKFIEDRYKVIEVLNKIVFDMTKYTNERDHIQKIVQEHFWLFGEQYHLASADVRMQKALEGYLNILYGEDDIKAKLNEDIENEKRMDIFLCNSREKEDTFKTTIQENIIVELKAPYVTIGKKVYRQVEDYMEYIIKQPAFNTQLRKWKFIIVGLKIDEVIKEKYEAFKDKGRVGLVYRVDNYDIYVFTWADIFKQFDLIHGALLKRLKYDREKISEELENEAKDKKGREKANKLTEIARNLGNLN